MTAAAPDPEDDNEGVVWLRVILAMPPSVWNVDEPVRRLPACRGPLPPPTRFVRRGRTQVSG